jgi:hypothetical protein
MKLENKLVLIPPNRKQDLTPLFCLGPLRDRSPNPNCKAASDFDLHFAALSAISLVEEGLYSGGVL